MCYDGHDWHQAKKPKRPVKASDATLVTFLGVDEIQLILKFLCEDDLLRLALVCKFLESQVEELHSVFLQNVWNHHKLTRPAQSMSRKGSFRRELHFTMKNPLYRVYLPQNKGIWGCRTLALSPSEDQLAIADIAIEQLCNNQDAYKVILWDLSRKEVVQTIHHAIVPAEHLHDGNYDLKLFWMPNDLLVTCSPASICVWSVLTGHMRHCYCRYRGLAAPSLRQDNFDMMRSFVLKDDKKIFFLAGKNSVHTFDIQNGLVQERFFSFSSVKTKMRDLVVCQNSFLIVLLYAESRNQGLLVVNLERSSKVQFFPGNYSNIFQGPPSSRWVFAFRIDRTAQKGTIRYSIDILDVNDSGILFRRKAVPFASATTQILTASDEQFFARDLVNSNKIMVVNSLTGEFESPLNCSDQASFFSQSTVVAPKRKELMVGLDSSAESGSATAAVFSLLAVNR